MLRSCILSVWANGPRHPASAEETSYWLLAGSLMGLTALAAFWWKKRRRKKNRGAGAPYKPWRRWTTWILLGLTVLAYLIPLIAGGVEGFFYSALIVTPFVLLVWLIFLVICLIDNTRS